MRHPHRLLLLMLQSVLIPAAFAGEADIGPVLISRIGVVTVASGGHLAGNFEIQTQGPFNAGPAVNCDPNYITTKRSDDSDQVALALLTTAYVNKIPLMLRITDDPTHSGYAGRCSLVYTTLAR